jgi:hypothetical protein
MPMPIAPTTPREERMNIAITCWLKQKSNLHPKCIANTMGGVLKNHDQRMTIENTFWKEKKQCMKFFI